MERYFNYKFWCEVIAGGIAGAVILFWIIVIIIAEIRDRKKKKDNWNHIDAY